MIKTNNRDSPSGLSLVKKVYTEIIFKSLAIILF